MHFKSRLRIGLALFIAIASLHSALVAQSGSLPESIEWTWEVRPEKPSPALPNVLLIGDSITRAYFPQVQKDLEGVANVYLMATSASIGDPRLPLQITEFVKMERVNFRVVHFNNGMHGWAYTEAQYRAGFPSFMHAIRRISAHPLLIWATTTPVRADQSSGGSNARIDERNRIAQSFVHEAGITDDDQHALMMMHQDQHADNVHYNEAGAALMGDQAGSAIRRGLSKPKPQ